MRTPPGAASVHTPDASLMQRARPGRPASVGSFPLRDRRLGLARPLAAVSRAGRVVRSGAPFRSPGTDGARGNRQRRHAHPCPRQRADGPPHLQGEETRTIRPDRQGPARLRLHRRRNEDLLRPDLTPVRRAQGDPRHDRRHDRRRGEGEGHCRHRRSRGRPRDRAAVRRLRGRLHAPPGAALETLHEEGQRPSDRAPPPALLRRDARREDRPRRCAALVRFPQRNPRQRQPDPAGALGDDAAGGTL